MTETNSFSVFVDNLPLDTTTQWLWKAFNSTGKVVDVYLSRKFRARNPLRFAFVRYRSREEVARTIEQLNGWIIWGCKLEISESKFRRGREGDKAKTNRTVDTDMNGVQMKEKVANRQGDRVDGAKSYKDALMELENNQARNNMDLEGKFQTLGDSKIYLEADNKNKEMLSRSLVGETLYPYVLDDLVMDIRKIMPAVISVKMVGPMKAIMTFESESSLLDALESEALANQFLEIRRWSMGEVNRMRSYWLEITGLPLHGWTRANMQKIGEVWGRVLELDEGTGGHYSNFRVLINSNVGPLIPARAKVEIEGEPFEIFVKEVGTLTPRYEEKRCEEPVLGSNNDNGCQSEEKEDGEGETRRQMLERVVDEEAKVEESIVGETQPTMGAGEKAGVEAQVHDSDEPSNEEDPIDSPTKTITLEDDRTTKQVLKEWDEEIYQVQCVENGPRPGVMSLTNNLETKAVEESPSSSLSVPPGFERIPSTETQEREIVTDIALPNKQRQKPRKAPARTSLKLSDRIKEKERRQKEAHKNKKNKIKEIREEREIGGEWSSEEEDIESSEDEIEATLWVGTRVSIETVAEDKARKYLKSKEVEVNNQESARKRKTSRCSKRKKGENSREKKGSKIKGSRAEPECAIIDTGKPQQLLRIEDRSRPAAAREAGSGDESRRSWRSGEGSVHSSLEEMQEKKGLVCEKYRESERQNRCKDNAKAMKTELKVAVMEATRKGSRRKKQSTTAVLLGLLELWW
ncbi:hypothetical protein PIB30_005799 [Stylosanthes scabra]|uniref:RRM domain-containing protein n=1 Tax=Stylosanthes scabra TaxID=79078 RepID=A0ABU6X3N6_9FABA|nr:hypothetical protein [Stylosanthes scabra]